MWNTQGKRIGEKLVIVQDQIPKLLTVVDRGGHGSGDEGEEGDERGLHCCE